MLDKYDHNLLLSYIEGDLSPKDSARVEAMLATDQQLATLLASVIADRQALRSMPPEVAPANLMETVNLRLERQMLLDEPSPLEEVVRTHKTFRLHRVLIYSGLAAMVLISAGVVLQTLMPVPWFDRGGSNGGRLGPVALDAPIDGNGATAARPLLTPVEDDPELVDAIQADRSVNGALWPGRELGEMRAMKGGATAVLPRVEEDISLNNPSSPPAAPTAATDLETPEAIQANEPVFFARLVSIDEQKPMADSAQNVMKSSSRWRSAAASADGDREGLMPVVAPQASPVAVYVDTDDAHQTHHELVTWALDNNARVLPETPVEARADIPKTVYFRASKAAAPRPQQQERAEPESAPSPPKQVLVVVTGSQIPELVEYLNRRDPQFADVVPAEGEESTTAAPIAMDPFAETPARFNEAIPYKTQRQLILPAESSRRLAVGLTNGWAKLLQQQLPLSPRTAVVGDGDELILPVRINVDSSMAAPAPPPEGPDPVAQ